MYDYVSTRYHYIGRFISLSKIFTYLSIQQKLFDVMRMLMIAWYSQWNLPIKYVIYYTLLYVIYSGIYQYNIL